MPLFTYITGLISILGFLLQIRDVFPQHREIRKALLYLVTGIFLGSILGSLQSVNVVIDSPQHPLLLIAYVALAIIATVLTLAAIAALMVTDDNKRRSLHEFIGNGFAAFVLLGFLTGLGQGLGDKASSNDITFDELITLSRNHTEQKNYGRAIALIELAKGNLPQIDIRHQLLLNQLNELKKTQVSQSH